MKKIEIVCALALAGCGVSNAPEGAALTEPPKDTRSELAGGTGVANSPPYLHGYTIEGLPTPLAFGRSSASRAICHGGGVVGSATFNSITEEHAVLYENGELTDLGTLGGLVSHAYDANALGTIVGTASFQGPSPGTSGPGKAFVYRDGRMTELPGIGGTYNIAYAVNDRDEIVGEAQITTGGDVPSHAVLWGDCDPVDLGTLDGGPESWARDINNAGDIVGTSVLPNLRAHAVVWRNGAIVDLGTAGALESQAYGINEAGTIAGFTRTPDRAVIWRDDNIV